MMFNEAEKLIIKSGVICPQCEVKGLKDFGWTTTLAAGHLSKMKIIISTITIPIMFQALALVSMDMISKSKYSIAVGVGGRRTQIINGIEIRHDATIVTVFSALARPLPKMRAGS